MGWSVLGAGIDALAGRRDNMFNKKEADRARDWAKDMANSEMQRRVIDLKKAGLNPMLAITEGAASTPSSAQATAGASGTNFAGAFSSWQMLRMAKEKNAAEVAQIEANTAKTVAEAKVLEANVPHSATRAQMETDRLGGELKEQMYRIGLRRAEAYIRSRDYDELQPLMIEYQRMLNQAEALGMNEREAASKFFEQIGEGSKWMEVIRNLLIGIRSTR